jgi:hypothetical protein
MNHSRSLEVCNLQVMESQEGLNKSQVEKLKHRKSMFQASCEQEKWNIVYEILFPDTVSGTIPTPCECDPFAPILDMDVNSAFETTTTSSQATSHRLR